MKALSLSNKKCWKICFAKTYGKNTTQKLFFFIFCSGPTFLTINYVNMRCLTKGSSKLKYSVLERYRSHLTSWIRAELNIEQNSRNNETEYLLEVTVGLIIKFINEWKLHHWEETILMSVRCGDSYIFWGEHVWAPEFFSAIIGQNFPWIYSSLRWKSMRFWHKKLKHWILYLLLGHIH